MTANAFLPSIAVGLIQWWAWCGGLIVLLAAAAKAAGPRRPAVHDLLCRALVVLELVLLPASFALCLKDLPWMGPAVAAPDRPAPASVVAPAPVRVETAPAVPVEPTAHPPAVHVSVAAAVAPATPRSALPLPIGLAPWAAGSIVAAYIAGVLIGSARLARSILGSLELASTRGAPPPERLLESLRAVARRMGVRRPVRLVMTEGVSVPLLAGLRRPVILLPPALAGRLSPAALEPLLAHELAHHVRRDVPWKLAHAIASVLAWPVPLQRRTGRTMARASEVLCDRLAAADAPGRESYARALYEVLAAERGSPPIAFGASAMASKSFLRRRIEIVLAAGDVPARLSRARTLALLLVAAACAAPVLALQVRAKPEEPPAPAKPAPAIRSAALAAGQEGDDAPEPIRRAQDELRKLYREQAAVEYAAGRHDQAEDHLRRAHELGATTVELVPLGGTVGALDLGRYTSPFVFWVIEKKFGALRIDPGYVVDSRSGLLIQEMATLERIRSELFSPRDAGKTIVFSMRFLRLGAEEAARWARVLGEDRNGSPEWSHALTAEESAQLEARIQAAADAKDKACVVEQAPSLAARDASSASICIYKQTSYIEKYQLVARGETQVADPVTGILNAGIEADIFQRLLDDRRVSALFRVTRTRLKELKEVRIDLPPSAHRVPIQVPVLEKEVAFHDAVIAEGLGTILGQAPATDEEKLHGPLERSWLWVKCQVIDR